MLLRVFLSAFFQCIHAPSFLTDGHLYIYSCPKEEDIFKLKEPRKGLWHNIRIVTIQYINLSAFYLNVQKFLSAYIMNCDSFCLIEMLLICPYSVCANQDLLRDNPPICGGGSVPKAFLKSEKH